ncbi:MAG: glycosyltransferase [Acidobacteria bacterium]|nr:glycosyltransferase [Acidobacteriota bacterium]
MRFLLVNNHCISDPTAGVTQSLRTIVRWLADAGHNCHVLTTARFESPVTFTIEEHLEALGVPLPETGSNETATTADQPCADGRPVVRYNVGGVPVTLLLTRHNDESRPDAGEAAHFQQLFNQLLESFAPDQVIGCNGHFMIRRAFAEARKRNITTAFAVRGFGYYERHYFEHVDHAFTCSQYLTDLYGKKVGLFSTPIEPPIDWSTVVAPTESRAFVTFVHPGPHKGLFLFARLADMLGSRRPDIPVLVVQSGQSGGSLNSIREIDFATYPQIMAAPPVPRPADYFALTRILLVPSVWQEPFGRVAAEAMINGVPPIVSNRGSLPQVIGGDFASGGGGRVVPLPDWLTFESTRLPSEREVEPWYQAVCTLWDDEALYRSVATRAREIAQARYSEGVSREQHVNYFTSLRPGGRPLSHRVNRKRKRRP